MNEIQIQNSLYFFFGGGFSGLHMLMLERRRSHATLCIFTYSDERTRGTNDKFSVLDS